MEADSGWRIADRRKPIAQLYPYRSARFAACDRMRALAIRYPLSAIRF
jgi:hypothetical protein